MPDQGPDEQQKTNQEPAPDASSNAGGRKSSIRKIVLACLLVVLASLAAYRFGVIDTILTWSGSQRDAKPPSSAFSKLPDENLISPTSVLGEVGKSPVDPAKLLLPDLDKPPAADQEKKTKSCPPELFSPSPPDVESDAKASHPTGPMVVKRGRGQGDPTLVETPVSTTKKPSAKADAEETGKADEESSTEQASARVAKEADEVPSPRKPLVGPRATERAKKRLETSGPQRGPQKQPLADDAAVKREEPGKGERFHLPGSELPGSLMIKISNYNGSQVKWGLMVILDDSLSMGKKVKAWTPNRSQAAAALVSKLPDVMTPGSQLAVRDFLCNKADSKKKPEACPSHILFPWAESPFKKLKEKVDAVETGGKNNPCAAAAYSLRNDFSGLASLSPRILIITGGVSKCAPKDVIKAVGEQKGHDKIAVDVITLGIGKKSRAGYAALVKKSNGLLLSMDKPADMDKALERYGKILKKIHWEKVEVKGEKLVVSMNPKDEIILAPGTYTVTLPVVANIKPGDRVIKNVKIDSGEARVLEISVKKGRLVVKPRKKKLTGSPSL